MDQLNNYADNRLIDGCIYCGGSPETRDHVPSKCLLDQPYPANLPVVGCCEECNQGFSKDEQYFVCLLECVLCGSTIPEHFARSSVAKIMNKLPTLRQRIEDSRSEVNGQIVFTPEHKRINNVMLKLARGHAAYELSQPCREAPNHFWCGPINLLSEEDKEKFSSAHFQEILGEIGSRNSQRLQVTDIIMQSENGKQQNIRMLINDWIDVQNDQYRYIAIDDIDGLVIRIVISEYFGCEVAWLH
ncbi:MULTISPECIES: hypothetical protein [unclassified Sphingobacterium]|uniref:hypothetical protein n=1 Tax=unclassified Sphingobacterium TaxID=2609468 RepID=UPI0025D881F4|nr:MULTISPECIES: hypothetical protein [unclassified Sphingobacterium]